MQPPMEPVRSGSGSGSGREGDDGPSQALHPDTVASTREPCTDAAYRMAPKPQRERCLLAVLRVSLEGGEGVPSARVGFSTTC